MKKTVSKPLLGERTERTPLLAGGATSASSPSIMSETNQTADQSSTYQTAVDVEGSRPTLTSAYDQASLTSGDWDARSLEASNRLQKKPSLASESMNNYLVFGSSTDQLSESKHTDDTQNSSLADQNQVQNNVDEKVNAKIEEENIDTTENSDDSDSSSDDTKDDIPKVYSKDQVVESSEARGSPKIDVDKEAYSGETHVEVDINMPHSEPDQQTADENSLTVKA